MASLLVKIFNQFSKHELKDSLKEWGCVGNSDEVLDDLCSKKKSKRVISREVISIFKSRRQKDDAVDQLDLIFVQRQSKRKTWTVYRLQDYDASSFSSIQTPEDYGEKLTSKLSHYFNVSVSVREKQNTYWLRIASLENQAVTYVVHHPRSPFLFINQLRQTTGKYLLQGLRWLLGCSQVEPMPLSGRCLSSLAQIAIRKIQPESFAVFQERQDTNDTFYRSRQRKRKAAEDDVAKGIIFENSNSKSRRLEITDETFGVKTLPTLEKLEYRLETPFHSTALTPAMSHNKDTFQCRVTFSGPSVLEGLRSLGEAGLAALPMRPHMRKAHMLGRNVIVLRPKGAINRTRTDNTEEHSQG